MGPRWKDTLAAVDWRVALMLPPKRRFSAEELRRAVPGPLTASFKLGVALNVALPSVVMVVMAAGQAPWAAIAALLALVVGFTVLGLRAWADPADRWAWRSLWLLPLAGMALVVGLRRSGLLDRPTGTAIGVLLGLGTLGLWFVVVYRHQYVALRLAELDERARAVDMARRLAAAQLAPHFLFNTLASVQHWVATRDARAGPLLEALTGYLRATLPLFDRPVLPLADELEAVRRYLQVMQARLGPERLAWRIELPDRLAGWTLPPGLLLTLVENAVAHGIEPRLAGGELLLRGRHEAPGEGSGAVIEVLDNGPGPAPGTTDGVGLRNVRERLALLHGPEATLSLRPRPEGGAVAVLRLPARAGAQAATPAASATDGAAAAPATADTTRPT